MYKYTLCVIFFNAVNMATLLKAPTGGYYWRDYEGVIPADALPGGLDRNVKSIYIGQILHYDKLIPGQIYENDKNIYYEWRRRARSATDNIKILCSQYSENFEWIPTKPDQVHHMTDKILIKGGHENRVSTYIGRLRISGETNVGKIICKATNCLGLYIATKEKPIKITDAFEILTYNPKVTSNLTTVDNCNPPIDVRLLQ